MEPAVEKSNITPEPKTEEHETLWHKLWLPIVICLVFTIIILIFDVFNWPSKLGYPMFGLNLDLLAIINGDIMMIAMFAIGYYYVDGRRIAAEKKRQKEKEEREMNRKNLVLVMMYQSYKHCKVLIDYFSEKDFLEQLKKRGVNPNNINDLMLTHFRSFPFADSHDMIVTLAQDGVIDVQRIMKYYEIKNMFASYVDNQVIQYKESGKIEAVSNLPTLLQGEMRYLEKELNIEEESNPKQETTKETHSC